MFEEQVTEETVEHKRKLKVYQYADALMTELGLTGLEPLATRVLVWQDNYPTERAHPDWGDHGSVMLYRDDGTPVVYVLLYIPVKDKPEARSLILGSNVPRWEKSHTVNNCGARPLLIEEWTYRTTDDRSCDTVDVCFYQPVRIGDVVNGCKVTQMERPYTEMVLACERG